MRIQIRRNPNLYRKYPFYSNLRENPRIKPSDTVEVRKSKINAANENAKQLKQVKADKMEEIVNTLDLFGGQLSLADILNYDIPFISELRETKNRINGEINKEREKQQQKLAQQAQKGGS